MLESRSARFVPIVLAMALASSAARAQDVPIAEPDAETLVLRGEASEVTALYVSGLSLLGTATLLAVLGGLTAQSGDSIGGGIMPLFGSPFPGADGLALVPIAAGYDTGVRTWRSARGGSEAQIARAHADLGERIAWTYGIGIGIFAASMGAVLVMYGVDQTLPGGQHLQAGHYLVPTGVSLLGIATILAGAGMDIAAGAWSSFVPSVTVLPGGGAMATGTGTF